MHECVLTVEGTELKRTSLDFAAQTVKGRTVAFTNLPSLLLPKGLQPRLSYSVIVNITFLSVYIQWILLCKLHL